MTDLQASLGVPVPQLRWICDPDDFSFQTTAEVEPIPGVVGQDSAIEALRFGLETTAAGQNVYVRGLNGTGRMTMIRRLLEELSPLCRRRFDRCYVHNFSAPESPRLITLPPGRARAFRKLNRDLVEFIEDGLQPALNASNLKSERSAVHERTQAGIDTLTTPFKEKLAKAGLALVSFQSGSVTQTALFPLIEGKPAPPEEVEKLIEAGTLPAEFREKYRSQLEQFAEELESTTQQANDQYRAGLEEVQKLVEDSARELLERVAKPLRQTFKHESVQTFVGEVIDDVLEHRIGATEEQPPASRRYGVNILVEHTRESSCPMIVETHPSLRNLLGTIEPELTPQGPALADYRRIQAGSLLRADGGYIILDARDVLSEPGAWKILVRTLRSGRLEIVPPELGSPFGSPTLKPEAVDVHLRVILVGSAGTYYALDQNDPDFSELFKVLADFDDTITRTPEALQQYAGVISRLAKEEDLLPFDRTAVAKLAEHGARIVAKRNKLTTRFSRIGDLVREASFLAGKDGASPVVGEHVSRAIRRTKERANLPSRKFLELLSDGTIRVETSGHVVGQINGLAVISSGMMKYGFPARITASIGPGHAGLVDIEGSASLSGSIHTKGFQILGGLLRRLLDAEHPLAFSASLAFEQSYGGIDGDSASGAEICCLLSALTDVPINQGLAITGAIDQMGHLQAIGGANEKIEGFFDTCHGLGLTGQQGVIIPQSNAGDLMLRMDVVEACQAGQFQIYAVETIHQAIELLTGVSAGERGPKGYSDDSLLGLAVKRAHEYWLKSVKSPPATP